MWWQALPSMFTTGGLIMSIFVFMPATTYIFRGRPLVRHIADGNIHSNYARHGFRKDWDKLGNEYESIGLDAIEDD